MTPAPPTTQHQETGAAPAGPARRRPAVRPGPLLLLLAYAGLLAVVTLTPVSTEGTGAIDNTALFSTIRRALDSESPRALAQVLGNGLLFLPFGVLAPWAFPRRSLVTAALAAAALSALIELVQFTWVRGRVFDVDDIALNAAGATVGVLLVGLVRLVAWLYRAVTRRAA